MFDGVGWAAAEIVVFMLAATLVGFAIGWFFGRWLQKDTVGEDYEAELASRRDAASNAEHRLTESNKTIDKLRLELKGESEKAGELQTQLEAAQTSVVELEEALTTAGEADADLAKVGADLAAESEKVARLEAELEAAQAAESQKVGKLEAELEAAQAAESERVARLEAELEAARASVVELEAAAAATGETEADLANLRAEFDDVRRDLDQARTDLAACGSESEQLSSQLASLGSDLSARDSLIAQLEAELAAQALSKAAPVAAVASIVETAPAPEAEDVAVRGEAPTKEEGLARIAEIAARTAGGAPAADDDLKKVKGIGPKLERTLKDLGITSFRQIANFEPEDIVFVTAALDAFKGRIERDDWMSGAAEQHMKKYNEGV